MYISKNLPEYVRNPFAGRFMKTRVIVYTRSTLDFFMSNEEIRLVVTPHFTYSYYDV